MTRPDDGPDATGEPGHRARAYAAALLGELTGGRRPGSLGNDSGRPASDPQGPAGVPDLAASTLVERPAPAEDEGSVDASGADDAQPDGTAEDAARAEAPVEEAVLADAPRTGEPDLGGLDAPEADSTAGRSDLGAEQLSSADHSAPGDPAPADPVSLVGDAAPQPQSQEPLVGDTPALDADAGAALAGGSPAVEVLATTASPLVGTPVRGDAQLERAAGATSGVTPSGPRPSPFAYVEVAAHHTGPARSRAHGALDAAGPQITARSDREQVRRAARTAVAAAALLDACDGLDERARLVDGTWDGERHGVSEVREFERAWSGFYDSAAALPA